MPESKDLVAVLREAEREFAEVSFSSAADERIRSRLRGQAASSRWLPRLAIPAFALAAAGVAAVALLPESALPPPAEAPSLAPSRPVLAGFVVEPGTCAYREEEGRLYLSGRCRLALVSPTLTVDTSGDVEIERRQSGARLWMGHADFQVAPSPDEPVSVQVSHGKIVVAGARFVVFQGVDGGHVDLWEGAIEFAEKDGETAHIGLGRRHRWGGMQTVVPAPTRGMPAAPLPAETEADFESVSEPELDPDSDIVEEAPEDAPGPVPSDEQAVEIIEEVTRLRVRQQYKEAAQVLEDALEFPWSPRAAEVLSFELGKILEKHLAKRDRACRHWQQHLADFPTGRYAGEAREAVTRLGCE